MMNLKLSTTYLILIIAPLAFGCRGPVKEKNKNNTSANSISFGKGYHIATKESVVAWKGGMLAGSNSHTGYVYISKGNLLIEKGKLTGGTAVVDMNTIEDDSHRSDNNLIKHLKNPDFFDVERFPTATITITKVESTNGGNKKVTGNLTIKGITQVVTFPAQIEVKDGIVKANGKLVIDRTKWGVRYKSGKFYDLLADQTMSDFIEFQVKIIARK